VVSSGQRGKVKNPSMKDSWGRGSWSQIADRFCS